MQVFGGIAFTEEHPAHRFLRRIIVREQQFGDAIHHERELGRARSAAGEPRSSSAVGDACDLPPRSSDSTMRPPSGWSGSRPAPTPEIVGPMLADILHDARWLACDVALISGGKSNLTYRVACDAGEVILRRPPLGHILPTAHDMGREYRVMTALADTAVPVPRTFHLGDADSPLGAPFYVMERVVGHICRNALPPGTPRRPTIAVGYRRDPGRRSGRPAHDRPRRGRPGRVRPPGGVHGAAAAAVVPAVGGIEDRRLAGARRSARRPGHRAARAARERGRPRRLPSRQHDPASNRCRARSSRCSTGR